MFWGKFPKDSPKLILDCNKINELQINDLYKKKPGKLLSD
ncbi:hypothetical protein PALB_37190 [Pseudoalteromonas luteoviolacea B = ATCC 29581]|nr:hypothetical protein PALB_37190 [Pseudoalteromonas luteoviolacea B = ATCC 29581]